MKILLFLFLINTAHAKDRPVWASVETGKCKETMREWILRRDAKDLTTDGCKIEAGLYEWVYYRNEDKNVKIKQIHIDHILPRKWFFENCFNSVYNQKFIDAYNEDFNLIATHALENRDKSDWVCNKNDKKYQKFLKKAKDIKDVCEKQYNSCLQFNEYYNNTCGDKCSELIYKE